jgi:hypothetical protein
LIGWLSLAVEEKNVTFGQLKVVAPVAMSFDLSEHPMLYYMAVGSLGYSNNLLRTEPGSVSF